jgi:hypothetical protein
MDSLVQKVFDGDLAGVLAETRKLREAGVGSGRIITEGVFRDITERKLEFSKIEARRMDMESVADMNMPLMAKPAPLV